MNETLLALAREAGFSHAAELDPSALEAQPGVREMCAADKCHAYGKNWTCPPACGPLEECGARMKSYRAGLLVQSTCELEDEFDIDGMQELEKRHLASFHALADRLRAQHPDLFCLGTGGCRICSRCAWPEPCRFPDRACSSMEAYGLVVSDVCKKSGLPYYYGKNTLTYTACYLWDRAAGEAR